MANDSQSEETVHFTPPLAWHHLSGGVVLLLGANGIAMIMAPEGLRTFEVPPRRSVLSLFAGYSSMRVLGRTIYQDAEDLKDLISDHFTLSACTAQNTCLAHDQ